MAKGISADKIIIDEVATMDYTLKELTFETQEDAENVLANLINLIHDRVYVSVMEYYNLADVETVYKDSWYGWVELNKQVTISHTLEDRWVIDLPKPEKLSELLIKN